MQVIERNVKGHTLYTLKAEEGMYISDGNIYAKTIHLGINSNVSDFHDVTEKEYQCKIKNDNGTE